MKLTANITELQTYLATAYAQAGALQRTLEKINEFQLTVEVPDTDNREELTAWIKEQKHED